MKHFWFVVGCYLGVACGFLTGCTQSPDVAEPTQAENVSPASTIASGSQVKIKTPDDQLVVEFKLKDDRVTIEMVANGATRVLRGEPNEKDKRKYESENGGRVAEVKPSDDGFKIRTPDGNLLWKVKIAPDKVKVSNNEENNNPFELEWKGRERVKVTLEQNELGEMKFDRDRQKVKVKDAGESEVFESNTERPSAAYGVLLLQTIPQPERYIIMAELLARGK